MAATASPVRADVVVPTIGRRSLHRMLGALAGGTVPPPGRIILVDDRRSPGGPLLHAAPPAGIAERIRVLPGPGRGPAAARNLGWRSTVADWVVFLDDDVVPTPGWAAALAEDLAGAASGVAGVQGRIEVPRRAGRKPTDEERNAIGLERARWATADLAYRRPVLALLGGFDERFRRAYREDADLGLRVRAAGLRVTVGRRQTLHPARDDGFWGSVRRQRGNADDALMDALHGRHWRVPAAAPRGRRPAHLATVAAAVVTAAGAAGRRPAVAGAGAVAWSGLTAQFAVGRMLAGPADLGELARMATTSAVIPFTAAWWWARGQATIPRRLDAAGPAAPLVCPAERPLAVLLDRDGTLIRDRGIGLEADAVELMPGARTAVDRLRRAGVRLAVATNQPALATGRSTTAVVAAVHQRIEQLLGPIELWLVCPHGAGDGCGCRKPAPGMVRAAARQLGVRPDRLAMVGDIGADVEAGAAAGARTVLVPTAVTRRCEVEAAPEVACDLEAAADLLLGAR